MRDKDLALKTVTPDYKKKNTHRDLMQERQPLLPHEVQLDNGLKEQVEALVASRDKSDDNPDVIVAQNKVRS